MHFIQCMYINTKANHLVDSLSRNDVHHFMSKVPSAAPTPHPVSNPLAGPTPQPGGGLDITDVAAAFQRYFQAGLAPSTKRTYGAAMKHFTEFCSSCNILDPFPLTELTLCFYVSFLAPQTMKAYLAALRNAQISMGFPDPRDKSSLPLLKRIQAGISRIRLEKGKQGTKVRLPITIQMLARIQDQLQSSVSENKAMVWEVACTAFFGFFRLGELLPSSAASWKVTTDLAWGDVVVNNLTEPRMVQVHLKKTKTDQSGEGADVVMCAQLAPL